MNIVNFLFTPELNTLKITTNEKTVLEVVAKKSLSFLECLSNFWHFFIGEKKWTYLKTEEGEGCYIKVDALKNGIANLAIDNLNEEEISSLYDHLDSKIESSIKRRLPELDNLYELSFMDAPKMDLNQIFEQINTFQNDPHHYFHKDKITVEELEQIFTYLDNNKDALLAKIEEENLDTLYIRHDEEVPRTIRIEKDGGIYIILKTVVGEGGFKKIRLAIDYNQDNFAVHAIARPSTEEEEMEARTEFNFLKTLESTDHIIDYQGEILEYNAKEKDHYKGLFAKNPRIAAILPFYDKKDVHSLYYHTLTGEQKKHVIVGMLKGLKTLHDQGIIHRDIKDHNFFVKSRRNKLTNQDEFYVVLGDLGTACKLDKEILIKDHMGTKNYFAPEIEKEFKMEDKNQPSQIDLSADCYSLGITAAHFLKMNLNLRSNDTKYVSSFKRHLSNTPEHFVSRFLELDPNKRLTVDQALEMVEKINWS